MNKSVRKLGIVGGLVRESVSFACFSMRSDKLRTFLSLFGVTVGIFSVVSVLCAVDSLKDNIMEGLRSFGGDLVYVDRFPVSPDTGEDGSQMWRKYLQRPEISENDYRSVARNASMAGSVVYMVPGYGTVSYGRRSYGNASLLMAAGGLENVMDIEISEGRALSAAESEGGSCIAVIGHDVARGLFGNWNPVGMKIGICGSKATVAGVISEQGESMASLVDIDNAVILPLGYGKTLPAFSGCSGMMLAVPAESVPRQEFLDELRMLLRSCRGLAPSEEDNFAINEMTMLLSMLDSVFSGISRAGLIIGAFSLLIGGFGIANIMFVSVQERMRQTGIQKALGARRVFILLQFLAESSFLSLAGGLAGVFLVLLVSLPFNALSGQFKVAVSPDNAIAGILVAVVLGAVSGFVPAWKAASSDPACII